MNKTSDENTRLHFDDLTTEYQQRVLRIQKRLRLATVEETLGWIAGATVENAYRFYRGNGSKQDNEQEATHE